MLRKLILGCLVGLVHLAATATFCLADSGRERYVIAYVNHYTNGKPFLCPISKDPVIYNSRSEAMAYLRKYSEQLKKHETFVIPMIGNFGNVANELHEECVTIGENHRKLEIAWDLLRQDKKKYREIEKVLNEYRELLEEFVESDGEDEIDYSTEIENGRGFYERYAPQQPSASRKIQEKEQLLTQLTSENQKRTGHYYQQRNTFVLQYIKALNGIYTKRNEVSPGVWKHDEVSRGVWEEILKGNNSQYVRKALS